MVTPDDFHCYPAPGIGSVESGYNDRKPYRLEDFFWTGSGDGSIDENEHGESSKSTTVYRTKTVLSTVYISTPTTYFNQSQTETTTSCSFNCDTTITPEGEISPTPTFEPYNENSTVLVPDADRQFWLLTVLKSDGQSPTITDLKNSLEKLYKTAFQRQQERHLGINSRMKRSISTIDKPVTVYIIKVSKSPINGDKKIEVLYHVSVSGQPVSATTAAADMSLVSDEEVINELGYPFIIKAEPYLKVSDPEYLSSTNNTWLFIGVALSILFVLLLLVAFITLALNKRKRTPILGVSNKQQIFHKDVGVGHTNKAFDTNDNSIEKTKQQSPTYINFRTQPSNDTLRSGINLTRPKSTSSSSSFSASSLDISPLMSLNKRKQRSPPRKLNFPRPKAALNKTAPVKPPRRNSLVFDSDSSCENSRRNSNDTIVIKNYDPGIVSPMSYLSMPSVKAFPRGNNPEPLNKVLEPVSVLHLDIEDENNESESARKWSGVLTRHGSLSIVEDPGVIGPVVWSEHCKRLQRGVSMDQGIDSGKLVHNVSRMRRRFHDLLDETFTLFGSRRESPVEDGRSIPVEVKSHSANANRPPDDLQPELQLRPKTSDAKRSLASKPTRGAWATNAPSPLSRPVSAGPLSRRFQPPQVEVGRILTEGVLTPSDPAVPLIAAIKTELGKCSLPGVNRDGASVQEVDNINISEDIIKLTKKCWLDVHEQPLSNKKLEEMMEELVYLQPSNLKKEDEEGDEKESGGKTLKTTGLTCIISSIEMLADELCEIDRNFNRSANVKRSIDLML
ncbi:hypothetical protein FQR65_LT07545 [Abscondita terminalis]|nr:hypothetical protein FQR65_LT07545 [Abscondita terminalis]